MMLKRSRVIAPRLPSARNQTLPRMERGMPSSHKWRSWWVFLRCSHEGKISFSQSGIVYSSRAHLLSQSMRSFSMAFWIYRFRFK